MANARVVVIAMGLRNSDFIHDWAKSFTDHTPLIPYVLVPPSVKTSHDIGEALSYMEYISKNYNNLPDHVVLLGDAGPNHWHAPSNWFQLATTVRPERFRPIGKVLDDQNFRPLIRRCGTSMCGHDESGPIRAYLKLFNVTYDSAKHDPYAGLEMVLSKKSIQRHSKATYDTVADHIRLHPESKWGWALDRIKGIVWG